MILESLRESGFHIENRYYENGWIYLQVDNMEVIIIGMVDAPETQNQLEFSREYLLRGVEFYKGIDEDREINNFIRCLIYYLKHPEYAEKTSWKNPRSIWEWIKDRFLGFGTHMDDAEKLERKDKPSL